VKLSLTENILKDIWSTLGGADSLLSLFEETGSGSLPSSFAVTDFATATTASAALALAEFIQLRFGKTLPVCVDRRLSSFWFSKSIRPIGWALPPQWDPIAGNYAASDGWIRLHSNAAHHRLAALNVLGCHEDTESVAVAVSNWSANALQETIISAGGVAAHMLSASEWAVHPQGRAVALEPLAIHHFRQGQKLRFFGTLDRPLNGLRVLDLTRILAGPVATRFLAGFGADVLRIDPLNWDEPAVLPEVTAGKHRARLDLNDTKDRAIFARLLSEADVIVHGYRADALEKLGFGEDVRLQINPDLIDISLDAYGWSGPWSARRGFDTIVQMSTGLAQAEMLHARSDRPQQLPVQALDYGAGHMMAAAVLRGLSEALAGTRYQTRFSLARTARELARFGAKNLSRLANPTELDVQPQLESTAWGKVSRLRAPLSIGSLEMKWTRMAGFLGSDPAAFPDPV